MYEVYRLDRKVISLVFIAGLLLGPIYTIFIYDQYYSNPIETNYPYYTTHNQKVLAENETYLGSPSTEFLSSITIMNNSIYSIERPSQIAWNNTFQNNADKGVSELLEMNMSKDFKTVVSSTNYLLPNLPCVGNGTSDNQYSRPYFDGKVFWILSQPYSFGPGISTQTSFISFDKTGHILTNLSFDKINTWNAIKNHQQFNFIFAGMYKNYFIVSYYQNKTLLLIAKTNLNNTIAIPFANLIQASDNFTTPSFYVNNVDEKGNLWVARYGYNKNYLIKLSLNDILAFQTSKVKEIINFNTLETYNGFPNALSASESLHGFTYNKIIDQRATQLAVENNHVIFLSFLEALNGINIVSILENIVVVGITKEQVPILAIGILVTGYAILVIGIVIVSYSKIVKNKSKKIQ